MYGVCDCWSVIGLPYFYEAAGVWAVLVLVCLAPLVDVVDVLGLVGFFAVVAFGFVLCCSHGLILLLWCRVVGVLLWCGFFRGCRVLRLRAFVVGGWRPIHTGRT